MAVAVPQNVPGGVECRVGAAGSSSTDQRRPRESRRGGRGHQSLQYALRVGRQQPPVSRFQPELLPSFGPPGWQKLGPRSGWKRESRGSAAEAAGIVERQEGVLSAQAARRRPRRGSARSAGAPGRGAPRPRRGHPAARRADQQPLAHEERLGDRLDGLGLLAHGDGEGGQPDRSPAEAAAQRVEHGAVEPVEARARRRRRAPARPGPRPVTTPSPRTWAQSRTRRSSRLAMRGVPRDRPAISAAPSASSGPRAARRSGAGSRRAPRRRRSPGAR